MVTVKCNVRLQDTDLKCEKEFKSRFFRNMDF